MLIDWFTVGAQVINFAILAWLLKRYLYKPVLHAIDAREKRIETELAQAAAQRAQAGQARDEFKRKSEQFDEQRAALLEQATLEAKTERQRLFEQARREADEFSAKRRQALLSDAQQLERTLRRRTQDEVFAIARKALNDLATVSLEERLGEVFTRRLRELSAQAKAPLAEALKHASEPALVKSAFELPPEQRAAIQHALNETFSADVDIRFETAPEVVCGIELVTGGHKLSWSITDYLDSLAKSVTELVNAPPRSEVAA